MNRNYTLDLLRVVLSLCVITLHSFTHFGSMNSYVATFIPVLLISADGLFYMLSGYFNLEKEFNSASDIKKYYKNKLIYVLFPFLAFVFVWTLWDYVHISDAFDILEVLGIYYETIMSTSANNHLWFMYPLFGWLLATPFISKALHNMNEKELKILWYIALGYNIISFYLCANMNINFRVSGWIFDSWGIYYIGGYYCRHVLVNESKAKWIVLGVLGFTFTMLGKYDLLPFFESFNGATDLQPMFTIFCMSLLVLWTRARNIENAKVQKVVAFLSRNTFLVYMYHMRGIEYTLRKLSIVEDNIINGFIVVFGTFVFSLIAAYVTNLCMRPVQKFIDNKWKIN